jgi:hypothetical protein
MKTCSFAPHSNYSSSFTPENGHFSYSSSEEHIDVESSEEDINSESSEEDIDPESSISQMSEGSSLSQNGMCNMNIYLNEISCSNASIIYSIPHRKGTSKWSITINNHF